MQRQSPEVEIIRGVNETALALAGSHEALLASIDPATQALDANQMRRHIDQIGRVLFNERVLNTLRAVNDKVLDPAAGRVVTFSLLMAPYAIFSWWPDIQKAAARPLFLAGVGSVGVSAAIEMMPEKPGTKLRGVLPDTRVTNSLASILDKFPKKGATITLDAFGNATTMFVASAEVFARFFVSFSSVAGWSDDKINSNDVANPVVGVSMGLAGILSSIYLIYQLREHFPNLKIKVPERYEKIFNLTSNILGTVFFSILVAAPARELVFGIEGKMTEEDIENPYVQLPRDFIVYALSLLLAIGNKFLDVLPKNFLTLEAAADVLFAMTMIGTAQGEYKGVLSESDVIISTSLMALFLLGPVVKALLTKEEQAEHSDRFEEVIEERPEGGPDEESEGEFRREGAFYAQLPDASDLGINEESPRPTERTRLIPKEEGEKELRDFSSVKPSTSQLSVSTPSIQDNEGRQEKTPREKASASGLFGGAEAKRSRVRKVDSEVSTKNPDKGKGKEKGKGKGKEEASVAKSPHGAFAKRDVASSLSKEKGVTPSTFPKGKGK